MRFNKRKLKAQFLIFFKNTKEHCPNRGYIRFFPWFSSILCVNTLEGSNNTIFRLERLDIAFSITGRTSSHSSPSFPQPRGGVEIDVICFALSMFTRSVYHYAICRRETLDISFSLTGRTSCHSSPPFPQPRGGIEIDVICFSLITRTRSVNPSWIYFIFEGFFQCSLVGKLIIYCGLSNKPDSVTNIFPVTTSPASHAFLYCL